MKLSPLRVVHSTMDSLEQFVHVYVRVCADVCMCVHSGRGEGSKALCHEDAPEVQWTSSPNPQAEGPTSVGPLMAATCL